MRASVGLMMRGIAPRPQEFPHPDFSEQVKAVIVSACRAAWTDLRTEVATEGREIGQLSENDITARLKDLLNQLLVTDPPVVSGFSAAIFQEIVRDAAVTTHDGSSLDKKPDLAFRLIARYPGLRLNEYRALFAECKIIDARTHPIGLYCEKGVARYVRGDYAWTMPSALMLGYPRDDSGVDTTLKRALLRGRQRKPDPYQTKRLPRAFSRLGDSPVAFVSVHRRKWRYTGRERAGDVHILHLWLR